MDSKFIFLNQNDIVKAGGLDMAKVFAAVEKGFAVHGRKECVQPSKLNLRKGPAGSKQAEQGLIMAMPSYVGGEFDIVGIKWVLAMTENPSKYGLPRSSALIILNSAETGLPLAIMDGTIVNAVRTGAVTGVGAKYLARPDSEVMALVGAGPQGRMQINGVSYAVPNLKEVRIYDISAERAQALADEVNATGKLKATVAPSAEAAVVGADIVVTATITTTPYLKREWLKPGVFYGDIASSDAELGVYASSDKLYTDDWEQIKFHGAGTLVKGLKNGEIDESVVSGNLGEVVIGQKPGREPGDDLCIFKHIGMSVTDLPAAWCIYQSAKEMGLGTELSLWNDKPVW